MAWTAQHVGAEQGCRAGAHTAGSAWQGQQGLPLWLPEAHLATPGGLAPGAAAAAAE